MAQKHEFPAPFTLLLANPTSPYAKILETDNENPRVEHQRIAKQLGYSGQIAKYAVDALHDTGKYVSSERLPGAERHVNRPDTLRSHAITISNPRRLARSVEKQQYPMDRISMRAMVELLLTLAEITPEQLEDIQFNIDDLEQASH